MDANDVRRRWAERAGEYSPAYYAYRGPNETSDVLLDLLDRFVDRTAPVLELGCSSGRHLAHLHDHGFENPVGVEVNDEAFDVMEDAYPDLAAAGEFHPHAIEEVVGDFDDDQVGAVYSVETLQHLHPDAEWVFGELARIADTLLVTAENERGHASARSPGDVTHVDGDLPLYHRDWRSVFTERGLVEVDVRSGRRTTVRAFRPSARTDR